MIEPIVTGVPLTMARLPLVVPYEAMPSTLRPVDEGAGAAWGAGAEAVAGRTGEWGRASAVGAEAAGSSRGRRDFLESGAGVPGSRTLTLCGWGDPVIIVTGCSVTADSVAGTGDEGEDVGISEVEFVPGWPGVEAVGAPPACSIGVCCWLK